MAGHRADARALIYERRPRHAQLRFEAPAVVVLVNLYVYIGRERERERRIGVAIYVHVRGGGEKITK